MHTLQTSRACHRFWNCYKTLTLWSLLGRCRIHCACHEKRRLNAKMVRTWCIYNFHLKCALRQQQRALFQPLNFHKWSEAEVFLITFWLPIALRAHSRVHFLIIEISKSGPNPRCLKNFDFEISSRHNCRHLFDISAAKLLRTWGALSFFTSKCASHASHHNSMQFFISHPATWLRTCRFSEPTFRPSGATKIGNTQCFAPFLHFRHLDLLSSGSFSSLTALTTVATSVHRSDVWLLNFLRSMNMWTDESMTQWIKKPTNQCLWIIDPCINEWAN